MNPYMKKKINQDVGFFNGLVNCPDVVRECLDILEGKTHIEPADGSMICCGCTVAENDLCPVCGSKNFEL